MKLLNDGGWRRALSPCFRRRGPIHRDAIYNYLRDEVGRHSRGKHASKRYTLQFLCSLVRFRCVRRECRMSNQVYPGTDGSRLLFILEEIVRSLGDSQTRDDKSGNGVLHGGTRLKAVNLITFITRCPVWNAIIIRCLTTAHRRTDPGLSDNFMIATLYVQRCILPSLLFFFLPLLPRLLSIRFLFFSFFLFPPSPFCFLFFFFRLEEGRSDGY